MDQVETIYGQFMGLILPGFIDERSGLVDAGGRGNEHRDVDVFGGAEPEGK